MQISFELPECTAWLVRLSEYRIKVAGRPELTPSEICKALVQECLVDDAAAHGLTLASPRDTIN